MPLGARVFLLIIPLVTALGPAAAPAAESGELVINSIPEVVKAVRSGR
jgi:hypothetical protein